MIGELPKLLGRDFVIAFLSPGLVLVFLLAFLASQFGIEIPGIPFVADRLIVNGVAAAAVAWFVGLLLLTTNRELVRLLEGYARYNPAGVLRRFELRRFRKLNEHIAALEHALEPYYQQGIDPPSAVEVMRSELLEARVVEFPTEEKDLMPTALGNTITAFEFYPLDMYGIDAVNSWPRLLAVIPESYRQLIDSAKAQMDLWINLWVVGCLGLLAYGALVVTSGTLAAPWLPLMLLAFLWPAAWRARLSAAAWGGYVKSAFDVFLPDLDKKLGVTTFDSAQQRFHARRKLSQALAYKEPDYLPNADRRQSETATSRPSPVTA